MGKMDFSEIDFKNLTNARKEKALVPMILKVLQDSGGKMLRNEIIEKISELNDGVAQFAAQEFYSKKTGEKYKKFAFNFNFALKNLLLAEFINRKDKNPEIILTKKGQNVDLEKFDVEKEVYKKN